MPLRYSQKGGGNMLALILVLVGISLRFTPHLPNFTPVAAIALFGGAYLNRKTALILPVLLMAISDLFIGMHDVFIFTWGGFLLITILGFKLRQNKNLKTITLISLLSSLLFYLITNFGVWLMGWYPPNFNGLITSYVMGIPFMRDFTIATLIYTLGFFGAYELVARSIKNKKLAKVLLN